LTKEKVGREPIEVVEIDQDFCALEYGLTNSAGTCNALLSTDRNKCYNTLGTCGDPDNYTASVLTVRFSNDQKNQPVEFLHFPFLKSVKIKAAVINPGSADKSTTALGKRATINASFTDHPGTDRYLDNYLAERKTGAAQFDGIGYDPVTRATFWRKWRARNLYYLFRPIRYISGYINEAGEIVDSITQSFVITKINGPDNTGKVSIQGKDVLTLAQTDKAEAPRASTGKASTPIDNVVTSLTLSPSGIGELDYPANGYVRIGEEVCFFTRVNDVLTLTRGSYNTAAESHDAGDTVQLCLNIVSLLPYQILFDLLNNYSNISADYLDEAQWIEESVTNNYLPLAYTTLITEPTPVQKLIAEMCEQMYFYTWFDTRTSLVKIKAVRAIGEDDITLLNYSENIIADSIKISDKPEQVITRVVINYAMFNPAKDLDEASNYRVSDVYVNLDLEGEDKNRSSSTKTIYSRWLTNTAGGAADELGKNLIARYQVPPEEITFSLDAKDRDLWTGDFAQVASPYTVDSTGQETPIDVQVMSGEETKAGTIYSYVAQRYKFQLPPREFEKTLRISANAQNINIRSVYDSQFPLTPPLAGDIITLIVDEGVTISSSSVAIPAMQTGGWPAMVELILETRTASFIVGKGGQGANGDNDNGGAGFPGGPGFLATYPITFNNFGTIGGGGGGGGAGAGENPGFGALLGGGGGGGGAGFGPGGLAGPNADGLGNRYQTTGNGTPGTTGSSIYFPGLQPYPGTYSGYTSFNFSGGATVTGYYGGRGGQGGAMGSAGSSGGALRKSVLNLYSANPPPVNVHFGGPGGAGGPSIQGFSNVTIVSLGLLRGLVQA
jgi:hypothetical protein